MRNIKNLRVKATLGFICVFVVVIMSIEREGIVGQGSVLAADSNIPTNVESLNYLPANETVANCRYGVAGINSNANEAAAISKLGAGWFLNFRPKWHGPHPANNAEHVRLLWVSQVKASDGTFLPEYETGYVLNDGFGRYIQENSGSLWLIGNEVDRGPDPGETGGGQGGMYPDIYAKAYHEIRAFIKKYDPSARTAVSGLVQVTPGRLQYLDKVWDAYQQQYGSPMPVDVWNMHLYVLPEVKPDGVTPNTIASVALGTDPALGKRSSGGDWRQCADSDVYCAAEHDDMEAFSEQVRSMRQWMKDHGQQQKPLILSEYSVLYPFYHTQDGCAIQDEFGNCFSPDRVSTFMINSFNLLNQLKDKELGFAIDENRLVQQWLWFSLNFEGPGSTGNILMSNEKTLTQVGETFRKTVREEDLVVNLTTETIPPITLPVDQSGRATATIQVSFRNNGNMAIEQPFTVSFYKDAARENKIGSVLIDSTVGGCATSGYSASVEWKNLPPGIHRFWVTVDSDNVIKEGLAGNGDNTASGLVIINSERSHIPMIVR